MANLLTWLLPEFLSTNTHLSCPCYTQNTRLDTRWWGGERKQNMVITLWGLTDWEGIEVNRQL